MLYPFDGINSMLLARFESHLLFSTTLYVSYPVLMEQLQNIVIRL